LKQKLKKNMSRLICILLTLLPFFVHAQSFWSLVEDVRSKSAVYEKALFQDSIILVCGELNGNSCFDQQIFAYDLKGEKLWEDDSGYYQRMQTDANFIYAVGRGSTIDDVQGFEQVVVSKFDKNGNKISALAYPAEIPHQVDVRFNPLHMDLAEDGAIIVNSMDAIIRADAELFGLTHHEVNFNEDMRSVHFLNASTYLISTRSKLYKSDFSFALIDSIELLSPVRKVFLDRDKERIYVMGDSEIVRLDTSFQVVDTIFSSASAIRNMEVYQDKLWVQLSQIDDVTLIHVTEDQIADTIVFPKLVDNLHYIVSEENFTFVGNSFSGQIGLYNFTKHSDIAESESLPNIELVDFDIEVRRIDYEEPHNRIVGFVFSTELTVRNIGTDTINNFTVYARLRGGVNCAENAIYRKINDVNILPGQTALFDIGTGYQVGSTNRFCFEVKAPNSNLEKWTDDNTLCLEFPITSVHDESPSRIKVYPNPVSDHVIIENPDLSILTAELLDLSGRVIIHQSNPGPMTRLETGDLAPGSYLLRVIADRRMSTQLIVKM